MDINFLYYAFILQETLIMQWLTYANLHSTRTLTLTQVNNNSRAMNNLLQEYFSVMCRNIIFFTKWILYILNKRL